MCGGFNSNVIRHLTDLINKYATLGKENILIYPIGKKVADAVMKMGYKAEGNYENIAGKLMDKEAISIKQKRGMAAFFSHIISGRKSGE